MMRTLRLLLSSALLVLSLSNAVAKPNPKGPPPKGPKMTRAEKKAANKELAQKMANMKAAGQDQGELNIYQLVH